MRPSPKVFLGPHAERMMLSLHADHCFLNTAELDVDVGLTTIDIMEAQLNRAMIHSAARVTVLAEACQLGRRSLAFICDFQRVQRVITNENAPLSEVEKLRSKGLEVVLL
jgi:DeoR/GlpR family transcriptional regulator of sugar metabolism